MKERPIIFSSPMVRAKLEDRKSMTRRIIKPNNKGANFLYMPYANDEIRLRRLDYLLDNCPYGKVGDRLWVQEDYKISGGGGRRTLVGIYLTDNEQFDCELSEREWALWNARKYPFRKTPGRFMYRSLSRILDEITDIRVERVQEISRADAKEEGFWPGLNGLEKWDGKSYGNAQLAFEACWNSINGPGAWKRNDYVWVISSKKVEAR